MYEDVVVYNRTMDKNIKKVAFHTLGCKLNYAETSTISRQFEDAGYSKIDFNDPADLYVINTCSVTENADREFRKIVNRAKRISPDSKIAVIGCYAQLKPEVISELATVDVVLGAKEKFKLLDHIHFDSSPIAPLIIKESDLDDIHGCTPSYSLGDRTRSFLKIQDGCDYPCTYCTIPMARGKSRSIDPDILVEQANEIARNGVKEIVLTGVNVGDYRFGESQDLLDLLKKLDQVDGIVRIRISSIEPNLLTDEIIQFAAQSESILPHFHIPLQSGSDTILKLMKRRYGTELYRERINAVREIFPNAGIGIDVIVGFPGEDEQEFDTTYQFLSGLDLSYLHVFTYSERPDTEAIHLPGTISHKTRKSRNHTLTDLSLKKNQSFALRQINQIKSVLFETHKDGLLSGMTENYLRVFVKSENQELLNKVIEVELAAFKDQKLFGTLTK